MNIRNGEYLRARIRRHYNVTFIVSQNYGRGAVGVLGCSFLIVNIIDFTT